MAAAAIPALTKAAPYLAAGAGAFFGGKKSAKPNAQQQAGMALTQNAGNTLMNQGNTSYGTGQSMLYHGGQNIQAAARTGEEMRPGLGRSTANLKQGGDYLSAAGNYYGKLLSGNRGELRSAVAPETAMALDLYKGAAAKTARTTRGASRTRNLAELDRQKVGQLALLPSMARREAASGAERVAGGYRDQAAGERATAGGYGDLAGLYAGLAGLDYGTGASLTGQGSNATANAGYLGSSLYTQGRTTGQDQREAGKSWGSGIFDLLSSLPGWGGGRTAPSGLYAPAPNTTGPQGVSRRLY